MHMSKTRNTKIFWGLAILFAVALFVNLLLIFANNPDMFFMIATGREIINTGVIPKINAWTIDPNQGFIAQQWLYAIPCAWFYDTFQYGIYYFVLLQAAILYAILTSFFKINKLSAKIAAITIPFIILLNPGYLLTVRPELITIILLFLECIGLEQYQKTSKPAWLVLLPVTMLLEINLHASMWIMHVAIMAAYTVPSFYVPYTWKIQTRFKWAPIFIFGLLNKLVTFCNPYGAAGAGYLFKSFMARTFNYLSINELQPVKFIDLFGILIILHLIILAIGIYLKILRPVTINMTCGIVFLALFTARNYEFMTLPTTFLAVDFIKYIQPKLPKIDLAKYVTKDVFALEIISILAIVIANIFTIAHPENTIQFWEDYNALNNICEYIQTDYDESMRIFTGFNVGSFLEFKNFKNIYIDARPEIYTPEFTQDKNLLSDYSQYCIYGFDITQASHHVTRHEMNAWIDKYDFGYLVINYPTEQHLAAYMQFCDGYKPTDGSYDIARTYQDDGHVTVIKSPKPGKGNVVKHMLELIDADIYLMTDADTTYHADEAKNLIKPVMSGQFDMALGDRLSASYDNTDVRLFHGFGNRLVRFLVNTLYHGNLNDIMTGYRAFNKNIAKNFHPKSKRFEIETEMCIFALKHKYKIDQIPIKYTDRPKGSKSKVNTIIDGIKIIFMILKMLF